MSCYGERLAKPLETLEAEVDAPRLKDGQRLAFPPDMKPDRRFLHSLTAIGLDL